jgi:DNA-binding NtrC family response regulator
MTDLRKRRKRGLVVDGGKDMREILTEYLNEFGYEVDCAANGREALQKYKNGHFDIVLSDLVMRPMDGMELLGEIRKFDPAAAFIMMTGYPSLNSAMEAMKKGQRIT